MPKEFRDKDGWSLFHARETILREVINGIESLRALVALCDTTPKKAKTAMRASDTTPKKAKTATKANDKTHVKAKTAMKAMRKATKPMQVKGKT